MRELESQHDLFSLREHKAITADLAHLLHNHELVHSCGQWVAHSIYVIARKVHQHHLEAG
jgi:hypothetical protein